MGAYTKYMIHGNVFIRVLPRNYFNREIFLALGEPGNEAKIFLLQSQQ